MSMYKSIYLLLILLFGLFSCDKTDSPDEPVFPDSPEIIMDGELNLSASNTTAHTIELRWDEIGNTASYEVFINDSIAETLTHKDIYDTYYKYCIYRLQPETEYKITVIALSEEYNTKSTSIVVKTKKSFVSDYMQIPFDVYKSLYRLGRFCKVLQTKDNGHIFLGGKDFDTFGTTHRILVKINHENNIEWLSSDIPSDYTPILNDKPEIKECHDGSFIITDYTIVTKVSSTGQVMWTYRRPFGIISTFKSGTELPDGSVIVVGFVYRESSELFSKGQEYFYIKLDSNGRLIWEKRGGTTIESVLHRVVYKNDGKLFALGTLDVAGATSENLNSIRSRTVLVEMDVDGNILREIIFPFNEQIEFERSRPVEIYQTTDNNYYIICSCATSDPERYSATYLIKIDKNGSVLWEKKGLDDYLSSPYCSSINKVNTIIIGANTGPYPHSIESKIIDSEGNIIRSISYQIANLIYVGFDNSDRIVYASAYGELIYINPDGSN